MTFISPALPPPSPPIFKDGVHSTASLHDNVAIESQSNLVSNSVAEAGIRSTQMDAISTLNIPQVSLDVEAITDEMAAKLATSLLGHVLFLKNQVPFPVAQLSRIPRGKTNARALKQRNELLTSFDTLSSHLSTTYTALSTAFARCASSDFADGESEGSGPSKSIPKVSRSYLAILVGPSLSSAKSKVIFAVEGLKEEIWGESHVTKAEVPIAEEEEFDEEVVDSEEEGDGSASGEEPEISDAEDSSENSESEDEEASETELSSPLRSFPSSPVPPHTSYAEQQRFLHNAERLLSHTLAAADADGYGLASELSPTQTHILLRAPRRFSHPAWMPRQNITSAMEGTLADFLEESGLPPGLEVSVAPPKAKRNKKGKRVEGVWITCRGGMDRRAREGKQKDVCDEDEMIWWSWDGKIVGFSDW